METAISNFCEVETLKPVIGIFIFVPDWTDKGGMALLIENAFSMVREGIAFLERTLLLGARFPRGKIFREDRFPVPVDSLWYD